MHDETGQQRSATAQPDGRRPLDGGAAPTHLRSALDEADLIERDIDGRRCYRITITDSGRGTVQGRGTVRQVAPGGIFLIDDLTRTELPRTLASAAETSGARVGRGRSTRRSPQGGCDSSTAPWSGHVSPPPNSTAAWAASWAAADTLARQSVEPGPTPTWRRSKRSCSCSMTWARNSTLIAASCWSPTAPNLRAALRKIRTDSLRGTDPIQIPKWHSRCDKYSKDAA